jgi:hypothetical protein
VSQPRDSTVKKNEAEVNELIAQSKKKKEEALAPVSEQNKPASIVNQLALSDMPMANTSAQPKKGISQIFLTPKPRLEAIKKVPFDDFRKLSVTIPDDDIVQYIRSVLENNGPEIHPHWAESCATGALSFILAKVKIVTTKSPIGLNTYDMVIGEPGILKSWPLTYIITPALNFAADLINDQLYPNQEYQPLADSKSDMVQFVLASRISVPSQIAFMSTHPNARGGVIIEEFSRVLGTKTAWESEIPEFLTEAYDGFLGSRLTFTHGTNRIDNLHFSLLTCSTPNFVQDMPLGWMKGGGGTRVGWTYIPIETYRVSAAGSVEDYSLVKSEEFEDVIQSLGEMFSEKWRAIDNICLKHSCKNIKLVVVDPKAVELLENFRIACEQEWQEKCILAKKTDLDNWDHLYLKRLQPIALKLTGIYSVSRNWKNLGLASGMGTETCFPVEEIDAKRAILRALDYADDFKMIALIRNSYSKQAEPESMVTVAMRVRLCLEQAPNKMLTVGQWEEAQAVTSDRNKFFKLKALLVNRGLVREVKHEEIKDSNEVTRLRLEPATKVYTVTS